MGAETGGGPEQERIHALRILADRNRAGVYLTVACAIAGTERALPRGRRIPKRAPIRVTFVEPIGVESIDDPVKRRAEAERLAGELREAIRPLLSY